MSTRPLLKFHTMATELNALLACAWHRDGEEPLQAAMESISLAWFPAPASLLRHHVTVCAVNSQEVADLRH